MPPIADIQQVDFAYGEQLVLKHINLQVEPGTILGVIGPNAGGKTTLLRLLLGSLNPTRGEIRVAGISPRAAIRRGDLIGYLPQNPHVPGEMPLNVRQLVQLGLVGKTGLLRRYRRDDLEFVETILQRVGLADLAELPVGELSGGQIQRAFIARALAPRPKLLLLDEPTTGIDPSGQQRFMQFLSDLKDEMNLTVVLVSHDLRTVSAISDRIACLNVTLHYHDVPEHLPAELVHKMFACDLAAIGIEDRLHRRDG